MARFSFSGPAQLSPYRDSLDGCLAVFACTASALAAGSKVLPPDATPKGYSLSDMAVDTAAYNIDNSEPLPRVPFEVLIDDATVKAGTMLYVPIFNWDNSSSVAEANPEVTASFPKNIRDQDDDADYLLDVASEYAGADITAFIVQVDGKTTVLCDDYTVGVKTEKLPDGGTGYVVSAAFIAPLSPGQHTVGIGGVIGGEAVVFVSYDVTVKP